MRIHARSNSALPCHDPPTQIPLGGKGGKVTRIALAIETLLDSPVASLRCT